MLTRRPEHADALSEHGLRISGKRDFTAHLRRAPPTPRSCPTFDLGIVATRPPTSTRRRRGSRAASPGDGDDGAERPRRRGGRARAHGAWPIISAVTFMSGIRHSDAHVEYELDTATWMGP